MRSVLGQRIVRLLFRLRTGLVGLVDRNGCRMISDEGCIICDSRMVEDMAHFWWVVGNLRKIGRYCK